jgi:Ca2+-binding RTX toxin-like protein
VLHYRAPDPGVGAVVNVTSPVPRTVVFKDATSPGGMDWGPCLPLSERRSRCSVRGIEQTLIEVDDGPDIVHLRVSLPATVDAGEGLDWVTGGFGADVLQGGPDDDLIEGGLGRDSISGGTGDDTLKARDGVADRITCGEGSDTVIADPPDIDEIPGLELAFCESVERGTAAADEVPPGLRVRAAGAQSVAGRALRLKVALSEPGSFVARAVVRIDGQNARRLAPARGRPDAPGQKWKLALEISRRLAASIRRALTRGEAAVALVSVRGRDRGGNSTSTGRRIRLKG